jgi:hypothetical protein
MKKLLFTATLFALVSLNSAPIKEVKEGMSEAEVKSLLGDPNSSSTSSNSYTINGKELGTSKASWTYNAKGKIKFEDGKVFSVGK